MRFVLIMVFSVEFQQVAEVAPVRLDRTIEFPVATDTIAPLSRIGTIRTVPPLNPTRDVDIASCPSAWTGYADLDGSWRDLLPIDVTAANDFICPDRLGQLHWAKSIGPVHEKFDDFFSICFVGDLGFSV